MNRLRSAVFTSTSCPHPSAEPSIRKSGLRLFHLCLCILGAFGISRYAANSRIGFLLVAFAICDLTWFGSNRPFNSTSRALEPGVTETAFAGSTELLNTVRYFTGTTNPPSRIDTIDDSLDWAGSAMITDVPSANGADPMVLIRYIQARLAFVNGERWGYYYQVTDPASPVLPSLDICCLLTRSRIPPDQLARSAYSNVTAIPGGFLYSASAPLARFHLVHQTVAAASMEEAAALAKRPGFNPKDVAIVENFPALESHNRGKDRVTVTRYRRNSLSLETQSDSPTFLASSEANYPGWKATIDGVASRIYDTNVAFRGISLPAGRHTVEFRFAPPLLTVSFLISVIAWAAWFVTLVKLLR